LEPGGSTSRSKGAGGRSASASGSDIAGTLPQVAREVRTVAGLRQI
jgi:hypothetical protein